jgi:EpsI family protein
MVTAIPLWDVVIPLNREITTAASVRILNGLGISSVRDGFIIAVSAGDFAVNQSCSGIAQSTSALAVTGLYAYLERLSLLRSAVLMTLGWLIAISGNVLRVVIIVAAGQASEMQHWLVHDHVWLGWVIFGIAITALLMAVGSQLPRADEAAEAGAAVSPPARNLGGRSPGELAVFGAAVLVTLSVGPLLATVATSGDAVMTHLASSPLPERVGHWQQWAQTQRDWQPEFLGADLERQALYRDPSGGELSLYVATYADQRQGKEAVYDGNQVYDRARWREAQAPSRYRLAQGSTVAKVEETLVQDKHGDQRLVWRWYLVRGRPLSGSLETKLASMAAALLGDKSAQVIVLSAPIARDRDASRYRLAEFARQLGEAMADSASANRRETAPSTNRS